MNELFPAESVTMDSPRLAWMKRHGIITYRHCPGHGIETTWLAGFQEWWPNLSGIHFCAEETAHNGGSRIGEGNTEREALASLMTCWDARKAEMKLWNEE